MIRIVTLLSLLMALGAETARAGWYGEIAAGWYDSVFRPQAEEATQNYYGYGATLSGGYSPRQIFDLGLFASYHRGRDGDAKVGSGDLRLTYFGSEMGFRIAEALYLGFRGGPSQISIPEPSTGLSQSWEGLSGSLRVGAVSKWSKTSFIQTTFEFIHHVVSNTKSPELGKRRLDSFSFGVSYLFNGDGRTTVENQIFDSFLDSINFF